MKNFKTDVKKFVILVMAIISVCTLVTACTDSYDAHDLQGSLERYASGSYSRSDERMAKGFYKWKADQDKYTG